MCYFGFSYAFQQQVSYTVNKNFTEENSFLVKEDNAFILELKKTYPMGLIISLYTLYDEQNRINQAFSNNKYFKFNTRYETEVKQKQIYIIVIGETSRSYNCKINGYFRNTNPFLSKQLNLVNFPNFLSISAETRTSIPMILTRKPAEQVYRFRFPEKSIISAFKEAGFSTYWISTQQKFGAFDTSTSVYAKEADHIFFLNKTDYRNKGDTDGIIIPALEKAIKSPEEKKFIIFHTLGSHYNYSHRYPKNFDIFRPSLNDINNYNMQDKKYKTELINSYDNSILYTDYILNEVVETLKKEKNTESFLLYSSDHGEDLFDGNCEKSGHGNTTIYNYKITSFVWYSDFYKKINPNKIIFLNKNKNRNINQTSIFPTLVDAANLEIPNDKLNRSLLKKLDSYPRLVNGGVDFDKTQPKGICKEVK
jgi:glucan phosphoethanolaminetransferase (alkaline phosphatase superfamily)